MGIWDFLTADYATRQQRTRDLNDRLGGLLSYYLGPTGIPDRLSSANALLNPIDQIGEAGANTVVAFDPTRSKQERIEATLNAGLGAATALAPAVAGKLASQPARQILMETIAGTSGQADVAPSAPPSEPRGILAYHGSPHDFDRFSMDRIGTGEGAHAYGHGLYFAGNRDVADFYRKNLSGKSANYTAGVPQDLKDALDAVDWLGFDSRGSAISAMRENPEWAKYYDIPKEQEKALDAALRAYDDVAYKGQGRLYEVNINANPEDFLDWDKPISEQSDLIKAILGNYGDSTGRQAYLNAVQDYVRTRRGEGEQPTFMHGYRDATQSLNDKGVAGIRYLDAASRAAGEGTSNYVVFDENLINIVRKYGIAGAAAMLGVSTMDVEQAMAQGSQPQPSGLLSPMEQ